MSPLPGENPSHVKMEPLPELDPERLAIQVELAVSTETMKLKQASDNTPKPSHGEADPMLRDASPAPQAEPMSQALSDAVVLTFLAFILMGIIGVAVVCSRLSTAKRWASIMETAGFVDWPEIEGLHTQIIHASLQVVAGGLAVLAGLVSGCFVREPRMLSHLILVAAIASVIGFFTFLIGWSGSKSFSDDMVQMLSTQAAAGANFNRGYCQAWCRHTDAGLAAFLRGDCGPGTPPVFDGLVGYFEAGDWCKQAIAQQNYDLVAAYDGISPFAGLKGEGGILLKYTAGAEILALLNDCIGISLFALWGKCGTIFQAVERVSEERLAGAGLGFGFISSRDVYVPNLVNPKQSCPVDPSHPRRVGFVCFVLQRCKLHSSLPLYC